MNLPPPTADAGGLMQLKVWLHGISSMVLTGDYDWTAAGSPSNGFRLPRNIPRRFLPLAA